MFEDIEKYLKKQPSLYFKYVDVFPKCKSIEDIIINFFYLNRENFTSIVGTKNIVCTKGCRRSIGDIYIILLHYFPELKIEDLYKGITESIVLHGSLRSFICRDIYKRVYMPCDSSYNVFNGEWIDEFNIDFTPFFKNNKPVCLGYNSGGLKQQLKIINIYE